MNRLMETAPKDGRWFIGIYDGREGLLGEDTVRWDAGDELWVNPVGRVLPPDFWRPMAKGKNGSPKYRSPGMVKASIFANDVVFLRRTLESFEDHGASDEDIKEYMAALDRIVKRAEGRQ